MTEVRLVDLRNTLRAVASGDFSSRLRLPAELVEPARLAVRRMLEAGRNDAAPAN